LYNPRKMLKIFVVFFTHFVQLEKNAYLYHFTYLSTFSKIKMRFHTLAYICTIKIFVSYFRGPSCEHTTTILENNYVFSWRQTRAFMFFLFPYFLLFFLNSKPLVIFLCWPKTSMYERTFVDCWKFCSYNTTNHVFSPYQ
jgi:hypothetical protein